MLVINVWWMVILIDILLVSTRGMEDKCQLPMIDNDYDVAFYTHYCNQGEGMKRLKSDDVIFSCQNQQRLKLINFQAFVLKPKAKDTCNLKRFYYVSKVNTSCLQQQERDAIVKPFLQELSGKTRNTVIQFQPKFKSRYKQIALEYGCQFENDKKVDLCEPLSETFDGKANVNLYFKEGTYKHDSDHTSCYCHFTAVNSTLRIIAQAFDIRLHQGNELYVNHHRLDSNKIYWWQSGVLNSDSGLSRISLSGLSMNTLPSSVWMDIYGVNMKIECHQLKKGEKEIEKGTDENPQAHSGSSSSGFGTGYILITVLAIVAVIIIIAIVVKCVISRHSNPSNRHSHSMDESDASQMVPKTSKSEDHPIPKTGDIIYSKPNEAVMYSIGDESEAQVLLCQTELEESKANNDTISSHGVTPDDSRETTNDEGRNIYNHFNENPDVVPVLSSNIYNTTAAEVYSTFQNQRQESRTDTTYDVA